MSDRAATDSGVSVPILAPKSGHANTNGGLPTSTSDNWLQGLPNTASECLKLPSGNTFKVSRILGLDNNEYVVLEVSD